MASAVLLNVIILVYNIKNKIIVLERISGRKLDILLTARSRNCFICANGEFEHF